MIEIRKPMRTHYVDAIDPGTRKGHGAARVDVSTRRLIWCDMTTDPWPVTFWGEVVVETPETVFGGTVETVIALARAAERAVRQWPEDLIHYVPPSGATAWKAGTKEQHQANVWDALDADEQQIAIEFCERRGLKKLASREAIAAQLRTRCVRSLSRDPGEWVLGNVIDAIGLGLWAIGRIDKFGRY